MAITAGALTRLVATSFQNSAGDGGYVDDAGAITLEPDIDEGVSIVYPALGSVDYDNVTPMLYIERGTNNFTPNLTLYGGAVGANIFEIKWASYTSGTYPRYYVNDSCQQFMQSALTVSGTQVTTAPVDPRGNNGTILPGTDLAAMVCLWQDVATGLTIRSTIPSSTAFSAQSQIVCKQWSTGGGTPAMPTNADGDLTWVYFADGHHRFYPSGVLEASITTGADVGLKRTATATLSVTDGTAAATGLGKLAFIIPTLADAAAATGQLFFGSDHSNVLCVKNLSGTVQTVNVT